MPKQQADASLQRLITPGSSKNHCPLPASAYKWIYVTDRSILSSHLVFTILDEIVSVMFDET